MVHHQHQCVNKLKNTSRHTAASPPAPPHPPTTTFASLPSSDGSGQNQLSVRCDRNPFTFILTNKSLRHRQTWITRFSDAYVNMYSPGCCPLDHVHPSHSEPDSSGKHPPWGQDNRVHQLQGTTTEKGNQILPATEDVLCLCSNAFQVQAPCQHSNMLY